MSAISTSNIAKNLYEKIEKEFSKKEAGLIAQKINHTNNKGNADTEQKINDIYKPWEELHSSSIRSQEDAEFKRSGKTWNVLIGAQIATYGSILNEKTHLWNFCISNQDEINNLRLLGASDPKKYAEAIKELKDANQDLSTLVFFLTNPLHITHKEPKPIAPSDGIEDLRNDLDDQEEIPDPFEAEVAEFEANFKGIPGKKDGNVDFFWVSDDEYLSIYSEEDIQLAANLPPLEKQEPVLEKQEPVLEKPLKTPVGANPHKGLIQDGIQDFLIGDEDL